jgi:hypothetical protein
MDNDEKIVHATVIAALARNDAPLVVVTPAFLILLLVSAMLITTYATEVDMIVMSSFAEWLFLVLILSSYLAILN